MYGDKRHLDNKMYDHFGEVWIPLESTESFLKRHHVKRIAVEFAWGVLASALVFCVSLIIICGLFR